jgi:hypothetical protein
VLEFLAKGIRNKRNSNRKEKSQIIPILDDIMIEYLKHPKDSKKKKKKKTS